jgi:hypothetical protein
LARSGRSRDARNFPTLQAFFQRLFLSAVDAQYCAQASELMASFQLPTGANRQQVVEKVKVHVRNLSLLSQMQGETDTTGLEQAEVGFWKRSIAGPVQNALVMVLITNRSQPKAPFRSSDFLRSPRTPLSPFAKLSWTVARSTGIGNSILCGQNAYTDPLLPYPGALPRQ